ncbi:MAG: GNAT family N-acetyltransferase [Granulosicoccus sp.]|nr:GNAT family N-acetyltransferase [Granulosicoccus sp.]
MVIREFSLHTDNTGLLECIISLQDFERKLDPHMSKGADIAEEYKQDLFRSCEDSNGKILVADINGDVAGYVLILTKVNSDSIDDNYREFGLIRDLIVLEHFRGMGVGGKLMQAAEEHAKRENVKSLRIEVLCANEAAKRIYLSNGFKPYTLLLEKDLQSTD